MSKTNIKNARLVAAYLSGEVVEFALTKKPNENTEWFVVYPYEAPSDIWRLSHSEYSFRIKTK